VTVLLIAVGVLGAVKRLARAMGGSNPGNQGSRPATRRVDTEFLVIALVCCTLLVLTIVLPYVSTAYALGREKYQFMAVLSVFLVLGGIAAARLLRLPPSVLLVVVLVPYFLGTTGVMYQVFGFPHAITLNSEGSFYYEVMYVHDQESRAATWLQEKSEEGRPIHADGWKRRLVSQGGISESRVDGDLASILESGGATNHYIYLRYQNVAQGELYSEGETLPIDEPPLTLEGRNKVYASNGSEVYR